MDLYVIRRPGAWATPGELQATAARSATVGNEQMSDRVRWIRTYVVKEADERLGTVCIYEASGPEAIRELAYRAGVSGEEILPVLDTVVIRDDPASTKA